MFLSHERKEMVILAYILGDFKKKFCFLHNQLSKISCFLLEVACLLQQENVFFLPIYFVCLPFTFDFVPENNSVGFCFRKII